MDGNLVTYRTQAVELRALLVNKDGEYVITIYKTVMIKLKNGKYITHYADECSWNGTKYQLYRIDRERNAVIFTEIGFKKSQLPRFIL